MSKYLSEIKSLILEISSNCNLMCYGCVRVDQTDVNALHPLIEKNKFLELETIRKVIDSELCNNLDYIDFCGSIDDPLAHPKFLEIVDYIVSQGTKVIVQTNASLRNPVYFAKLAEILKKQSSSYVKFSIDGLEDTNHLYRRGSNWDKIIENANAYIAAGGKAEWQYIAFPWNEHQIEIARELSIKMGFKSFRYRHDRGDVSIDNDEIEVKQNRLKNDLDKSWQYNVDKFKDVIETQEIDCYSQKEKQYFIRYDGTVWPCCFLSNAKFHTVNNYKEYKNRFDLNYEKNWNSLYYHSFEEILNSDFYKNDLVKSWNSKVHGTGKCDRIIRCTTTCSKKLQNVSGHKVVSNE